MRNVDAAIENSACTLEETVEQNISKLSMVHPAPLMDIAARLEIHENAESPLKYTPGRFSCGLKYFE
jgi:hypothetical protein